MTENKTYDQPNRDDRNDKSKGKGKHKYAGLATDGPVKGITVNPGRDQATELKRLLKATIVHVSDSPTLKIVSNILKYKKDINMKAKISLGNMIYWVVD